MKSINVNSIIVSDKGYSITLWNGIIHTFKSKRLADKFQTKVNKFLTAKLFDLNQAFAETFLIYRLLYPTFSEPKRPDRKQNYYLQEKIKISVFELLNIFELSTDNANRRSSFHRVFTDLKIISDQLLFQLHSFNSLISDKSIAFLRIQIESKINIILNIQNQINTFNHTNSGAIISFDRLHSIQSSIHQNSLTA
jgi:hypothetical protein